MHIEYNNIISIENLLNAWCEFRKGKRSKKDVEEFSRNLMDNIIFLHTDLKNKTYSHGEYKHFKISDPKPRDIHKASVRDRLVHHAIYRVLYPYFDNKFIYDSYSCRNNKGTHKAINRLGDFARKISKNNTKQCYILKCDIRKFFASINHKILNDILTKHVKDKKVLWLLNQVINSFNKGLPLGNLTSQLLVNIYMNEFDQFVKRELKTKYYIRYADDFIFISNNKEKLHKLIPIIFMFLEKELKLYIHDNKIKIKTIYGGIDYLGWIHFPHNRVLRNKTKRRLIKNCPKLYAKPETVQSYLGLLKHGNTWKIKEILNFC